MITLFLRIADLDRAADAPCTARWLLFSGERQKESGSTQPQALTEVAEHLAGEEDEERRIIVLLPGHDVMLSTVTLPPQQARHMHKAVAYAVEDQLAESADEVHIAIGKLEPDEDICPVAIIRDGLMQRLMNDLNEARLVPDTITSEALLLPAKEAEAWLVFEDNRVLFRLPDGTASNLEAEMFLPFLEHYLAKSFGPLGGVSRPFATVQLWAMGRSSMPPPVFLEPLQALCGKRGISIAFHHGDSSTFEWLCRRWLEQPEVTLINLRQGNYQPRGNLLAFLPAGRAIAVIVGVWLAAQLALYLGAALYLNYQAGQMHAQSEAVYRRLFPGDARIVDIRSQMQQHLVSGESGETGIIPLLAVLAGNMSNSARPTLEALQYDAGKKELAAELTAESAAAFDAFKSDDASPVRIEIGTPKPSEKGMHIQLHFRMKEKKP